MGVVSTHNMETDCWVVIHGKVVDVTQWRGSHPGGSGVFTCGADLTAPFTAQHGDAASLLSRLAVYSTQAVLLGELVEAGEVEVGAAVSYDFSNVVRQAHPGNGQEFKTLVYVELKGALDAAAAFVNVKTPSEVHLWCSKRPTLSAAHYCECEHALSGTQECTSYVLSSAAGKKALYPLSNTDGHLAMTELLAGDTATSWLPLWDAGDMALVPGVGRYDHGRSHFEVKDAAAKGVTTGEEPETRHGWLAKSIFAHNSLYCQRDEALDHCRQPGRTRMVDGISLANAAAGPNALEVSDTSLSGRGYLHISGVQNVQSVLDTQTYNYGNPFLMSDDDTVANGSTECHVSGANQCQGAALEQMQMTAEEAWASAGDHPALSDLLAKEEVIFQGMGVVKGKLAEYTAVVEQQCPSFPPIDSWADSNSDAEIGMQLRAVATLLINDVRPKVFQVQQTKYDTHSNQRERLEALLGDLRTGVHHFVAVAKACGFWHDTLLLVFSEFGRRFEENSRKGTDHGWGQYFVLFGSGLTKQVYGHHVSTGSSALADIIPSHSEAYDAALNSNGDLPMKTDIEAFNACVLDSLALPGLQRVGACPASMRLRATLPVVLRFDEAQFYAKKTDETNTGGGGGGGGGDNSHLQAALTPAEVLHVARRIGYSTKSLGLDQYLRPGAASISLQAVLQMLLDPAQLSAGAGRAAPVYTNYVQRKGWPFPRHHVWNSELSEPRNAWGDLMGLAYPRKDSFAARVQRWGMQAYFDLGTLSVDPSNEQAGAVQLAGAWAGQEGAVFLALQEKAASFFVPMAVSKATGTTDWTLRTVHASGAVTVNDPSKVDWYLTIMQTPDVLAITSLTAEQMVEEYRCDLSTGKHPTDPELPCSCDLPALLNVDSAAQTAFLYDTSWAGPDGTKNSAPWWILRECAMPSATQRSLETTRYNAVKSAVEKDLYNRYFDDFRNPAFGLRARMTWFYMNWYATPVSGINNDWLMMAQQYRTVWEGALGNYRTLALQMFNDPALRKSLDQLEKVDCGTAPIENFAREYFERFTVGLEAHNEGDIKLLARGLMNCPSLPSDPADAMLPGVIFSDPAEEVRTETAAQQKAVVDRVLDFRPAAAEPPAAAQFLCDKLYREFAVPPEAAEGEALSAMQMPPPIVQCASKLYDHGYDVAFALEHIFEDRANFKARLGHRTRWPLEVVLGATVDYSLDLLTSGLKTWAGNVGQLPFHPQDVSGFDLDNVWTLDRIAEAHEFLATPTSNRVQQWWNGVTLEFETEAQMRALLAEYQVPGSQEMYSFATRMCDRGMFVEEAGASGAHLINMTAMFEPGRTDNNSRWKRRNLWKASVHQAITNVCQFVS